MFNQDTNLKFRFLPVIIFRIFVFLLIFTFVFSPLSELARLYLPERLANQITRVVPETPSAYAAINTDVYVFITVASNSALSNLWPVPADWNPASNSIEVIGAGGTGGDTDNSGRAGGGGGGGYSKIMNLSFAAASISAGIPFNVGAGGANPGSLGAGGKGDNTWFGKSTYNGCFSAGPTVCVSAEGGEGGAADDNTTFLSSGGGTSSASGTVKYAGGDGGARSGTTDGSSGGGGAGGPLISTDGNGENGGIANSAEGSGGGGAGGASATVGQNSDSPTASEGGNGGHGYGGSGGGEGTTGAGGGGSAPGAGGAGGVAAAGGGGANGAQWNGSNRGSGGGGGGAGDNGGDGGLGGSYGGGGGGGSLCSNGGCTGGDGIIVIKYRPLAVQSHFRWYNDDGAGASGLGELYYNPTGNGFGTADFTINAGCSAGSEWDCVDDNGTDTSASAPTSDNGTSSLQSAAATDYYTLADDAISSNAVITRIGVAAYAVDTGQPNTNITLGYCTTCDGANDQMAGSSHDVGIASNTKYSNQFEGLSLTPTDLNNVQLIVQADGVRAQLSTVYASISYTFPAATQISEEDIKASSSEALNINSTYRLRLQIANQKNYGDIAFTNHKYRLEMARAGTNTCNTLSPGWDWQTVPITATIASHAFDIEASNFISDGASTSAAVMSTPSGTTTFVSGYQLTARATSGYQTIPDDSFTEISWNLKPNSNANTSADYCFRAGWIVDDSTTPDTRSSMSYSKIASASVQAALTTTFAQNDYEWFYNVDDVQPVGSINGTENSQAEIGTVGVLVRLRMNVTIGTANLSASSQQFKLQWFKEGGAWTDVGTGDWVFKDNGLVADPANMSSALVSTTNVLETYNESNPTSLNPNGANNGQNIEYDWSLDPANATPGIIYTFRMIKSNDNPLDSYDNYPAIRITLDTSRNSGGGGASSPLGDNGGSGGGTPQDGGSPDGGGGASENEGPGESGGGEQQEGGGSGGGGGASPVIFDWRLWFDRRILEQYF